MSHSIDASNVLACDLGKTSCRLRLAGDTVESVGAPGLAETNGVAAAALAIDTTAALFPQIDRARFLAVGAAGALSSADASLALARRLASSLHLPVAVTSDVVTAHAGAFSGGAGTLLIAGTGAVAISIDEGGRFTRLDGNGPWLGDEGSGQWIGRSGLRAVLRASDGRSSRTALTAAAHEKFGAIEALPRVIGAAASPARELARFAPDVLRIAEAGDETARRMVHRAVEALAESACAADVIPIALAGGLTQSRFFRELLIDAITAAGGCVVTPEGDALDGACVLAIDAALPHERFVHRVA